MKVVIQRVLKASVEVNGEFVSSIGPGVLSLIGIAKGDQTSDAEWMVRKILNLRIFEDADGKMNHSLLEKGLEHLMVSQFTLLGETAKGNRPSFIEAAPPTEALLIFESMIKMSTTAGAPTKAGRFRADMKVSLINDGPVTLILDSKA